MAFALDSVKQPSVIPIKKKNLKKSALQCSVIVERMIVNGRKFEVRDDYYRLFLNVFIVFYGVYNV